MKLNDMATDKKRIQVILTDEEVDILKRLAEYNKQSMSAYIRTVLITNPTFVKLKTNAEYGRLNSPYFADGTPLVDGGRCSPDPYSDIDLKDCYKHTEIEE